jgi:hypothetical protein
MALPVTLQFNIFWGWVKGLFLHSGKYGSGESNIINWEVFLPNLNSLWNENYFFFYAVIVLSAVCAAFIFIKRNQGSWLIQKISFAVITAIVIQLVIVCKQFEPRYFIPALMLFPVILILLVEFFLPLNHLISKFKIPQAIVAIFILFYFIKQVPVMHSLSTALDRDNNKKMPTLHYMETLEKDAVKFLVPGGYGCPTVEYALMCSYGWAGRQREIYKPVLGKLFPDTYIYYPWDKTVNYWGNEPNINETDKVVYIYLENEKFKEPFLADTKAYFPVNYELTRTFFNETTNEVVYKLTKVISE